jgi:hypothetical protein
MTILPDDYRRRGAPILFPLVVVAALGFTIWYTVVAMLIR